jgi:hypothetical protein
MLLVRQYLRMPLAPPDREPTPESFQPPIGIASCDPLATPRPLGPLIDMLAQLPKPEGGGLAAAINGVGAEAIYTRLLGSFADGNSWVCAMEDVHWADGATLDLLRFLARRVGTLPVLLLVSYRDDEVGAQHPLAAALGPG